MTKEPTWLCAAKLLIADGERVTIATPYAKELLAYVDALRDENRIMKQMLALANLGEEIGVGMSDKSMRVQ